MNVKDKVPLAIDQLNHFARELKTDMNSIHLKENDLNDRHAEYQHEYVEVCYQAGLLLHALYLLKVATLQVAR